jgi:feruloyl esterase
VAQFSHVKYAVADYRQADPAISPLGTKRYYDEVTAADPSVQDYYRLFYAPGVSHCEGGVGAYPDALFDNMVKWVEQGIAPDTVNATSPPDSEGKTFNRPLCPYPKQQYYKGSGDITSGENFGCK